MKPLTGAELELMAYCHGGSRKRTGKCLLARCGDWPCETTRMVAELRELRRGNAVLMTELVDASNEVRELREQNAALVAALEAVGDHEICDCPGTTCLVWLRAAAALASVRGDA